MMKYWFHNFPVFIFKYDDIVQQNSASIQIAYMWKNWVKFHYCQMVQYDFNKVYVGETKHDVFVKNKCLRYWPIQKIRTKLYFLRVVLNFGYNYKNNNKTDTCQFILKFVCLIQLLFCTKNVEKRSLFILLVIWYIHSINNSAKKIHGMLKLHRTQNAYFDTDVWYCLLINSLQ